MSRFKSILSRLLTVIIIFLVAICLILFFKIVTNSDVSIGGIRFYYVATESMYPTIKPHAMMVVKETDPENLKEGDIISFVSRDPAIYGMVNTHRIYQITEDNGELAFVTMGDHNPTPDSLLVYPDEIKGKVIFYTPPMKGLTSFLSFAGTQMGFFIVILMPLMLVAAMFFGSFIKEFQASLRRETEELEALRLQKQQEMEAQAAKEERERLASNASTLKKIEAEAQLEELFGMEQQKVSVPTSDLPKEVAEAILEQYFGKKISEITEEDITKKLAKCDTSVKNNGIIEDNKNDVSKEIVESENPEQEISETNDTTEITENADTQNETEIEDTVKVQNESDAQKEKEAGDGK